VHVFYAGEKVLPNHLLPAAKIIDSVAGEDFQVVTLEAIVRMKLNSFRRKDQVHLLDLLGVGLIDETWLLRFPAELAVKLQTPLDDPLGQCLTELASHRQCPISVQLLRFLHQMGFSLGPWDANIC
jgi:hypothetical protein